MKIEIGESLTASYLRHVKSCRIVQTNWKTSDRWSIIEEHRERAKKFYDEIISSDHFTNIFKDMSFNQLLKQAEIDVLGVDTHNSTVYGIDVAFHSNGINYGSKEESSSRIVKKILRTLLVMQTHFNEYKQFKSLFITPKTNQATLDQINVLIKKAKELLNDPNITINFITNEKFYSDIIDPTLSESMYENDTSELFLRSIKLLQLDPRKSKSISSTTSKNPITKSNSSNQTRTKDGMKIGEYVRHTFKSAFEKGLISDSEVRKLQDRNYSNEVFNSNYEILRSINEGIKDENGRNRYYATKITHGYYLTNDWYERHWDQYLDWLKSINYYK